MGRLVLQLAKHPHAPPSAGRSPDGNRRGVLQRGALPQGPPQAVAGPLLNEHSARSVSGQEGDAVEAGLDAPGLRRRNRARIAVLKRDAVVHTWDESMIGAGEVVDDRIRQQLDQANLILLLVSSDFLASDKLYEEQLRQALQRNREGKAYIIPILVRPCAWEGAVFSRSKFILPRKQTPIASWDDKDAACRNVVLELEKYLPHLVENLQA